jgi:DnaK suppressor protein
LTLAEADVIVARFRGGESPREIRGFLMKAKSSKARVLAAKPAKAVPKKAAKPVAAKPVAAKPAAAKAAGTKSSAKKTSPAKPSVKTGPKAAMKAAPKPATKASAKTAPKAVSKIAPKVIVKVPKFGPKKDAKEPVPQRPKAPVRRVPKPASVATRRKESAHFRELLLKKRQQLMHAYSISKGDSQSDLDNGTEDYVDYAVNSYAREFLLSLTELDRKQLLLVEEALNRIDRGEYGYCQQCGEEISRKRLDVQPWARHCVRCQELEEKGILPQYPSQPGDEDEIAEEPEEPTPADDDVEPEIETEDEALDDEPLVVDGDDSEE